MLKWHDFNQNPVQCEILLYPNNPFTISPIHINPDKTITNNPNGNHILITTTILLTPTHKPQYISGRTKIISIIYNGEQYVNTMLNQIIQDPNHYCTQQLKTQIDQILQEINQ